MRAVGRLQTTRVVRIALGCLLLAGIMSVAARRPILQFAGQLLVVNDDLRQADVIIVAIDAGASGVLEAADLVHVGISSRVAVFNDPPNAVDRELIRRGVPWEDWSSISTHQLYALGVSTVEIIPRQVAGTDESAQALPDWLSERGFRSAIIVTTPDHSRRLHRMLMRSLKGHSITVIVRVTKYSGFDARNWWTTRGALRTGIVELQKLFLDFVMHPSF
jgi:hypothetical protein